MTSSSSLYDIFEKYWLVAMRASELKIKPQRRLILGKPVVFYRHERGVAALLDRCPHRNAPLSTGRLKKDCLSCPYHGWMFGPDGECRSIPGLPDHKIINAPKIPTYHTIEQDGLIWIYMGEGNPQNFPYKGRPVFDQEATPDLWHLIVCGDLVNILENFLDGTHTHFVHAGLIRSDDKRGPITAHLTGFDDAVHVRYIQEGGQSGLISRLFDRQRGNSFGRFILPGIAELEFCTPTHTSLMITVYFTPETETTFSVHATLRFAQTAFPSWMKKALIYPFFKRALMQDLDILKQQHNTIALFNGPTFFSTSLDILRPSITQLLAGHSLSGKEKTIQMRL